MPRCPDASATSSSPPARRSGPLPRCGWYPLDVLTRSESIRYLCGADDEISETEADGLANMLGDLPLALAQLAATRKATGMPLARYLDLFERHVQDLLRTGRAPYYPASLGATVKMSIEHLNARGAVLLLIELFAHLGPDPVPWALLRCGRLAAVTDVLKRCIDDVAAAQGEPRRDRPARADQGRGGQPPCGDASTRAARAAREPERRVTASRSGEHPRAAGRGRARRAGGAVELAGLRAADPAHPAVRAHGTSRRLPAGRPSCDQIRYLHEIGDYERSKAFAEAAIASWSQAPGLGTEHESTLRAMRQLANALRLLGRFTDARELNERVMATFERNPDYGPDHPLTLEARTSAGTDLHISGEYEQALAFECETYAAPSRRIRGADHPSTLNVANNRGNSHRVLGPVRRGRALAPAGGRPAYGGARAEPRPHVLRPVELGLGSALPRAVPGGAHRAGGASRPRRRGPAARPSPGAARRPRLRHRAAQDRPLRRGPPGHRGELRAVQRVVRRRQRDHPRVGDHVRQLARRGRPDRPRPPTWRPRPARACGKSFGGDNPITLATAVNAATIVRGQGRWNEAADTARHSWVRLSRQLGPEHPYAIFAANNVATGLYLDGLYGHAHHMSESVLVNATRRYARGHPDRLVLTANAGLDLRASGDEAGESMRQAAVDELAEVLSPDHPVVQRLRARERVELDIEPPPL